MSTDDNEPVTVQNAALILADAPALVTIRHPKGVDANATIEGEVNIRQLEAVLCLLRAGIGYRG